MLCVTFTVKDTRAETLQCLYELMTFKIEVFAFSHHSLHVTDRFVVSKGHEIFISMTIIVDVCPYFEKISILLHLPRCPFEEVFHTFASSASFFPHMFR